MTMLREMVAAIAATADWKNLSEIAQAFATTAAVAAAGIWPWHRSNPLGSNHGPRIRTWRRVATNS